MVAMYYEMSDSEQRLVDCMERVAELQERLFKLTETEQRELDRTKQEVEGIRMRLGI